MEKTAQQLYSKIFQDFASGSVVVLDCGHFDSVIGVDEFSTATAGMAVRLFEKAESLRRKGLKVVFAVLLDDVGMSCDTDAMVCMPKDVKTVSRTAVPTQIRDILKTTTGFRSERLKLFSEKTARNRGIQFYRKHLHKVSASPRFSIEENAGGKRQLLFTNDQGSQLLMADLTTDSLWTGHCPLLMAMHYRDIAAWASKLFSGRNEIHIIDFSLSQDRGKVNGGAQIATTYTDDSSLTSVVNVCSADEDLDVYTVDTYKTIGE